MEHDVVQFERSMPCRAVVVENKFHIVALSGGKDALFLPPSHRQSV